MLLFDQINEDIKKAMLAKDKERLEALRAVKAAFLLAKTDNSNSELTYEREIAIIQKLIKQRNESAELYKQNNRNDLYEVEKSQAQIISEYLPKQLSNEEVYDIVSKIIKDNNATTIKDMGRIMGISNNMLAGKTDSKTISGIVKQILDK